MNGPGPASGLPKEGATPEEADLVTDELVDDLCYAIAVALREILDLEETSDDAEK